MQNPEALRVYADARRVAVLTYGLTRKFPVEERFGLSLQMRRAAVSVGSNIAEGCGRQGNRALIAFLHIALGSATELEFQLVVAVDAELCAAEAAAQVRDAVREVKQKLTRLIVALRTRLEPSTQ